MRSFNEGWALRETLPALRCQDYSNWELIVIDSGSTDGSLELIRTAAPSHLVQIEPQEYNPSRVMNHGMQLAQSEFGIFLNADATPQGQNWLRPLVETLSASPQAAAVFSRQVPRPECYAVFASDYEHCFGIQPRSEKKGHFFSMVSSGLRKDVWARRAFREDLQYAEDDEYTRWCKTRGFKVVYCPASVVMHSHNYTPVEAYRRSFGDARALALAGSCARRQLNPVRTLLLGWLRDIHRDLRFCLKTRQLRALGHAAMIRWQQRKAKLDGFRSGMDAHFSSNYPVSSNRKQP